MAQHTPHRPIELTPSRLPASRHRGLDAIVVVQAFLALGIVAVLVATVWLLRVIGGA
jgi:hypothetical protein